MYYPKKNSIFIIKSQVNIITNGSDTQMIFVSQNTNIVNKAIQQRYKLQTQQNSYSSLSLAVSPSPAKKHSQWS